MSPVLMKIIHQTASGYGGKGSSCSLRGPAVPPCRLWAGQELLPDRPRRPQQSTKPKCFYGFACPDPRLSPILPVRQSAPEGSSLFVLDDLLPDQSFPQHGSCALSESTFPAI